MKKQILAMVTCLMMCTVFVFSGFTSNAQIGTGSDGLDFYVPYSKPEGDGVGYASIVLEKNSQYYLTTLYWCIQPYTKYNQATVNDFGGPGVFTINGDVVTVELNCSSNDLMAVCVLGRYIDTTNTNDYIYSGIVGTGEWYTKSYDYSVYGYQVVGVEVGGNCIFSWENNLLTPRIHWGGDNSVEMLNEILLILGQNQNFYQTYFPKLNHMDFNISRIRELLEEMQEALTSEEQGKLDEFEQDSGVQSDELSSLNQQTQVDKIDVDSASQTVDANLNVQTDANYGVLLSTFTSNDRILTMLLLVASVSLISFVLFGKR